MCIRDRCVPVNGTFSARQREIYESVLHCLKEGSKLLKAGVHHSDYEKQMAVLIEQELIKLKLLTPEAIASQDPDYPAYKKYFMHGTAPVSYTHLTLPTIRLTCRCGGWGGE